MKLPIGDASTIGFGVVYASVKFVITLMNISLKVIEKYGGYPTSTHPMLSIASSDGSYVTKQILELRKEHGGHCCILHSSIAHG